MKADRIVFDTNVLISAALSDLGKPSLSVRWARVNATTLMSKELLDETRSRLLRPRFRKYVSILEVEIFLDVLMATSVFVALSRAIKICRDPNDDMVLDTAVSASADVLVTGDQDLLVLDPFRGIRIVTPAAFLGAIGEASVR